MELISSFEALVLTRATRRDIPDDAILHSHRHENLKSYMFFRLRRDGLRRLLFLTEPFTWEGAPTRDPHTGRLTMASLTGRINNFTHNISVLLLVIQFIYIFSRSISSEGRLLQVNAWYPFETLTSPQFEIVNATQVSS
jgi:hypothetical protein